MPARRIYLILWMILVCPRLWADAPNGYYLTGFDYYAHKDYTRSIPYLQAAVEADPQDWRAWQVLGFDYYLSHQPLLALPAFDQSLKCHPDNPQLWNMAESIRAKMIWEAERRDAYPRVFRNPDYDVWVKLHGGFISASLGDLPKGAPAFQSYYTGLYGHASSTVDGTGPLAGLEVGFMLDKFNTWGVDFDGAAFNGYKASANDNFGNTLKGTIQPNMISAQAEYIHYFKLGTTRLWLGGGGGFYETIVELNYVKANSQSAVTLQTGELVGIGYGGFLGLGWDIALGDQLSANIYVKGRYATTGDIEGVVTYSNGAGQASVLAADSNGLVSAVPTGTTGVKSLNIDYTGQDMGLSVSYHY